MFLTLKTAIVYSFDVTSAPEGSKETQKECEQLRYLSLSSGDGDGYVVVIWLLLFFGHISGVVVVVVISS